MLIIPQNVGALTNFKNFPIIQYLVLQKSKTQKPLSWDTAYFVFVLKPTKSIRFKASKVSDTGEGLGAFQ